MKCIYLALVICLFSITGYGQDSIIFNPGTHLRDGFFTKLFLGKNYRDIWKSNVKAPILNLNETDLKPVSSGGRMETNSLRFEDSKGRSYAGRSVKKDLSGMLPDKKRNGFMGRMLRDHASSNEPYAALVVASLANNLQILHCNPKLYVLPLDNSLGEFSDDYQGMAVLLEERPNKSWNGDPFFGSPEMIEETEDIIKERFEKGNITFAHEMYLKGRLLDILIGDWSRHDEQYRWSLVPRDSGYVAYPIPKDRDHAFFRNQGILKELSVLVWPYTCDFKPSIKRLNKLNHMAANMDNLILPEIPKETWFRITREFMNTINDQVIEKAVRTLPPETYAIDGKELETKLKSRLKEMPVASNQLYQQINKYPFIPATDKKDKIRFEMNGDSVRVAITRKKAEEPYFQRTFSYPDTRLITVAALDGKDHIEFSGHSENIRLNILQGPSNDEITNKLTDDENIFIYDTKPRKIIDYLTSGIKNESKHKKRALNQSKQEE